jgi:hypothetical protein
MRRKRHAAAICIQRAYRAYFRRMYSGAFFKARVARNFLHHKAAVRINAAARGRLGRRYVHTYMIYTMINTDVHTDIHTDVNTDTTIWE